MCFEVSSIAGATHERGNCGAPRDKVFFRLGRERYEILVQLGRRFRTDAAVPAVWKVDQLDKRLSPKAARMVPDLFRLHAQREETKFAAPFVVDRVRPIPAVEDPAAFAHAVNAEFHPVAATVPGADEIDEVGVIIVLVAVAPEPLRLADGNRFESHGFFSSCRLRRLNSCILSRGVGHRWSEGPTIPLKRREK